MLGSRGAVRAQARFGQVHMLGGDRSQRCRGRPDHPRSDLARLSGDKRHHRRLLSAAPARLFRFCAVTVARRAAEARLVGDDAAGEQAGQWLSPHRFADPVQPRTTRTSVTGRTSLDLSGGHAVLRRAISNTRRSTSAPGSSTRENRPGENGNCFRQAAHFQTRRWDADPVRVLRDCLPRPQEVRPRSDAQCGHTGFPPTAALQELVGVRLSADPVCESAGC